MDVTTLLADPATLRLESFVPDPKAITLVLHAAQTQPRCPRCRLPSTSLHSHYQRSLADLPWHGVAIKLQLHSRKFRCCNQRCRQKVFCERLAKVADAYARKTVRLNDALTLISFALGGEAGSRTARGLGLFASGDTLLRRIRRTSLPPTTTPRALGVDDWAKHKGHSYGTILVDLERRKPLDLLPDREAETLAAWLTAHPGIEIITRDRAGTYADGARSGAPKALQVADRWHLLRNISEAMEKLLHRNHKAVRQAFQQLHSSINESPESRPVAADSSAAASVEEEPLEREPISQRAQQYHAERRALYRLVKELQRQGLNINQIRLQIKRHHSTVARFFHADS